MLSGARWCANARLQDRPNVISQSVGGPNVPCPTGAGFTSDDQCFSTTFNVSHFTPGDWRFVAEFYTDDLVGLAGIDYRVHTFLVTPESPIGAVALVGASMAGLGGYMFWRRK